MSLQKIFILFLLVKFVVLKPATQPVPADIKHAITDQMRENARDRIFKSFLINLGPNKTYRFNDQLIKKFTSYSECAEMNIYNNLTATSSYNASRFQNASELDLLFHDTDLYWTYSNLVTTAVADVHKYMMDTWNKVLDKRRKLTQKLDSDENKLKK